MAVVSRLRQKNHPINPEGKIVENDHLTNGKVKLIYEDKIVLVI